MRVSLGARLVAVVAFGTAVLIACSDSDKKSTPQATAGSAGTAGDNNVAGSTNSSGAGGAAAGAGGTGLDMFTAWERARAALRTSPDHLPARADNVVASKDPTKIFEFVRDAILTYPPAADGFEGATGRQRWGVRGTLRGGAGTPREKAELLVSLYERAGLEAEIVVGRADAAKVTGQKLLLRANPRKFAPLLPAAEVDLWNAALGHADSPPRSAIDANGSKASELATQLLAQLPTDLTAPFDFTLSDLPLVRVKVNGVWQYANPCVPDAKFGESLTQSTPSPSGGPYPTGNIRIRLEAARADAPYDRFELVSQSYEIEDVVGRRIQLGFAPPVPISKLVTMRVQDIETLVPVLSVIGADMTREDKERLAKTGNMFSLGGDQYELDSEGKLSINGEPIADAVTDPAAVARVQSVKARVNGAGFPRVSVTVTALDADGKQVPKLGASAFELLEDGKPVPASLTRIEAPPPRVVLLFDASSSIPAEFRGDGAVTIGNQIVEPLYAQYPSAELKVAFINFGAHFVSTNWASSLTDAKAQVAQLKTAVGGSEIWEALYDVERQKPTVIIMVTDGDTTDTQAPKFTSAIGSGVPVLSIGVGTVKQTLLDEISKLSGGKSVPVTLQSVAVTAALQEISARAVEDYVLSYQAPASGAGTRKLTVRINGKSYEVTYDVPTKPSVPPVLSGLYLTIGIPGREETLPVAGFGLGYSTAFPEITQRMLDDVRALLLGRISISVEAAAPSASVVLDDWIGEKLSLRPLWEATASKDTAAIIKALEQGLSLTPPKLPLSQAPLPGAASTDALTFETAPRIATLVQKATPGGAVSRQLSVFPLSQWATAAEDPRAAWERTLKATAGVAVIEAQMFSGPSTLELLTGKTLTRLNPGAANDQADLTDVERLRWAELERPFGVGGYQLLVPQKPGAFWAVDTRTGTVIGMLPDGTGGGAEDVCATYDLANAYLQYLGLLGNLFGLSFGGWTAIGQWEVKNLTMATLVIGYGADAQDISNPATDFGCGALGDAIGDAVPAYSAYDAVAGTLDTIGMDTGLPTLCGGGPSVCE